jgi:hypothetical protein
MSVFKTLNDINVNGHTEKKNGLTYLAWAWAWGEVKKAFPEAFYTIYENADGWNYFTDGRTGWVKTGVTIEGIEHIEYLPIMDFKNKSIPLENITSFDVNKAIQRSLTKACARHGLGLYIYAGEDLPEEEAKNTPEGKAKAEDIKKTAEIEALTIAPVKAQALIKKCEAEGVSVSKLCELHKIKGVTELTEKQYRSINDNWDKVKDKCSN